MAITGSCHCGKTAFRIDGEIPSELTYCTCSFCSKRGALVAYYPPEKVEVTVAPGDDHIYRWNTRKVAHHSCAHCGLPTYSDSPDFQRDGSWDGKTRRLSMNARLFDNFDAAKAKVSVIDGKNLW